MIIRLILIELYKVFKKWRAYIGFIGITVLITLIQYSMYTRGRNHLRHMTYNMKLPFGSPEDFLNGYTIAYFMMHALLLQLPFLIIIVVGELLAGEAVGGTFRILVTRPVSRFSLLSAKYISGIIYTCLLLLWFIFLSLGIGIVIFGTGNMLVMSKGPLIIPYTEVPYRFIYAYLFSALAMISIASLAFLFSSFVENAMGPIISTITVVIVFTIISNINIDIFQDLRHFIFTNYIPNWKLFFENPLDKVKIIKSVIVLAGHSAAFYLLSLYIFQKKDILS